MSQPTSIADRSGAEDHSASVPAEMHGWRLDQAAARLFPSFSRARLQAWIDEGRLRCNGAPVARRRDPVTEGDTLELSPVEEPDTRVRPQALEFDVLYEDDDLAIVNKPAGLTVHPGAGAADGTLQNALLHRFPKSDRVPRAGIVHRLDKDTSGLLVVALSVAAHTQLVRMLQAREIRREYDAVVSGRVTAGSTVDAPIGRDPQHRTRMAVAHDGRDSVTHFRVEKRFAAHTWLRVRLETGRTHQIRVHMKHLNHPIVGDATYGGRQIRGPGLAPAVREALASFPRQALHARLLQLQHPLNGSEVMIEAPLPADMAALVRVLAAESPDRGD